MDFIDICSTEHYNTDMKCLNCGEKVGEKAKYCSDKCRMAYSRRTKKGEQPEQNDPEHQPEQARTGLTRTDSLFEKRKPGYYYFTDNRHARVCKQCGKDFKTSLELLKYCSPKCMSDALGGQK